jgi:hypothetical protein
MSAPHIGSTSIRVTYSNITKGDGYVDRRAVYTPLLKNRAELRWQSDFEVARSHVS